MAATRLISIKPYRVVVFLCAVLMTGVLGACSEASEPEPEPERQQIDVEPLRDPLPPSGTPEPQQVPEPAAEEALQEEPAAGNPEEAPIDIEITEDYRSSFDHGPKGAEYQKYIVLHDTEGDSGAASVIDWWDGNGNLVAAHFIVNRDGSIWQCVPLDRIAHHAGYGDTGHNDEFGISEDGRDDMKGSSPLGSAFADYGMNAWSVGIEMVHVGGEGDYPEEQLNAVDALIAHIDDYYGFESEIIDHKAWRSGNSDTSPEFADYLESYQAKRTHQ